MFFSGWEGCCQLFALILNLLKPALVINMKELRVNLFDQFIHLIKDYAAGVNRVEEIFNFINIFDIITKFIKVVKGTPKLSLEVL